MKKIISILLSALLLIGCVAMSATADVNVYTIDDVALIDNYVAGSWEKGTFETHERRIATNGYVAVDASKTYTLVGTSKNHSNLQFYLAEFDADKNCVAKIGRTVIAKGTYAYTPSSADVAYIALTITIQGDAVKAVDTNGIFNRFINGGYGISMVADGESGGDVEEPESSTVTETTTTTTTTTTKPVDTEGEYTIDDVANPESWTEGQYNSLGKFASSTTRACVKKLIKVDPAKTYVLEAKNAVSKKYVVREYDADRTFLRSVSNISFGSKYTPTDATVAYIALTMYEGAPYADIAAGVILPSMVEYVEPVEVAITMIAGAGVRFNEVTGMRYKATVDTQDVAYYEAQGYTVTMGTLIAPADKFASYEDLTFEADANNYLDVVTTGYFNEETGTIAGSISNIKEANYGRNFIARSYVKLEKDGETYVSYAVANDNTRSIKTLANAVLDDDTMVPENEAQLDLLNKWAAASDWA